MMTLRLNRLPRLPHRLKALWLALTLLAALPHGVQADDVPLVKGDAPAAVSPLYLQVQTGTGHPGRSVFHIRGRFSTAPWYVPHHNLGAQGLIPGASKGITAANMLEPGQASPWVDISPLLAKGGINRVRIRAVQGFTREVEGADFEVLLSTTASEEGLIRKLPRTGRGSGLLFTIDQTDLSQVRSDTEWSGEARREAQALGPVPGRLAQRFPLITSVELSGTVLTQETLDNEAAVMKQLGINALRIPTGVAEADHITRGVHSSAIWHLATGGSLANPQVEKLERTLGSAIDEIEASTHPDRLLALKLMDEPSATTIADLAKCPVAPGLFVEFLKGQGLSVADLGVSDWDEAKLTQDQSNPYLYVQSVRFQTQVVADYLSRATELVRARRPDIDTTVNFDNALTYRGNMLARGIDWFAIHRQEALTFGWSEDWCNHATTFQFSGLICDMLRAACEPVGQSFGMYNVLVRRTGWDVQAKSAAEIGRGARAIHYFNYGPEYALSSDQNSSRYELYPDLRRINYAIGEIEDHLIDSRVAPSRLAMLYSHSTDTWALNEDYSMYGKEMLHLWLLARHLNQPIDFVTEADVEQGALDRFQALIVPASHVSRAAADAVHQWVERGGLLLLSPGAAQRDQWNQPLDLSERLGLRAEPFNIIANPKRDIFELPKLNAINEVVQGGKSIPAVSGVQHYYPAAARHSTPLLAFKDGTPAVTRVQAGRGQVYAMGMFLGLSYGHVANKSLAEARRADKSIELHRPRAADFPAPHRDLLAQMLQPLGRPAVRTSSHVVQADVLRGEHADVLVLSNWSGEPIDNVTVHLDGDWSHRTQIRAVQTDNLDLEREDKGLTLELPVAAFEFIVLQ